MSVKKIYFQNTTGVTLYLVLRTDSNERKLLIQVSDIDPGLSTNRVELENRTQTAFLVIGDMVGCCVDGRLNFELQTHLESLPSFSMCISKKIMPDGPTFLLEPSFK